MDCLKEANIRAEQFKKWIDYKLDIYFIQNLGNAQIQLLGKSLHRGYNFCKVIQKKGL